MDGMVGRRGMLKASYYDDCRVDRFNTCGLTSSGAIFHPNRPDNAASPIFPDGTVILAYNPATKLAAVLRVTSTGPYRGDRTLDVSRATAEHLGFVKRGVAPLEVVVLNSPTAKDARYKKLREYAPVPGFIGRFETFEAAHDTALQKLSLDAAHISVAAVDPRRDIERLWPRSQVVEVAHLPAGAFLAANAPPDTIVLADAALPDSASISADTLAFGPSTLMARDVDSHVPTNVTAGPEDAPTLARRFARLYGLCPRPGPCSIKRTTERSARACRCATRSIVY